MSLAPCPCGAFPTSLTLERGRFPEWAYACGSCCARWHVEFRIGGNVLSSKGAMREAVSAWNAAPRARPVLTSRDMVTDSR